MSIRAIKIDGEWLFAVRFGRWRLGVARTFSDAHALSAGWIARRRRLDIADRRKSLQSAGSWHYRNRLERAKTTRRNRRRQWFLSQLRGGVPISALQSHKRRSREYWSI